MDNLRVYVLFNSSKSFQDDRRVIMKGRPLTIFQSYQDEIGMIIVGCKQWNPVYSRKEFHLKRGLNLGLLDQ